MSSTSHSGRVSAIVLFMVFCIASLAGCSGGKVVPTKIYEGGGTAPEVVDQPEKPASRTTQGSPKR